MARRGIKVRDRKREGKRRRERKRKGKKRGERRERDKSKGVLDRSLAGRRSKWQTSTGFASSPDLLRLRPSVTGIWGTKCANDTGIGAILGKCADDTKVDADESCSVCSNCSSEWPIC